MGGAPKNHVFFKVKQCTDINYVYWYCNVNLYWLVVTQTYEYTLIIINTTNKTIKISFRNFQYTHCYVLFLLCVNV